MNTRLTLTSLLAALALPLLAGAAPSLGHVGTATFNLTVSYQDDDERTVTDTATVGKYVQRSVIRHAKFSNKQFIGALLETYDLSGRPDDWKINFVNELGFFLVSKNGESVRFIGGSDTTGLPINITDTGVSLADSKRTTTETRVDFNVQSTTTTGFVKGIETTYFIFTPVPFVTLTGVGITDYHISSFTNESATYAASSVKSIVADDDGDEGLIITGSIHTTAMTETNLSAYQEAYQVYLNSLDSDA